MKKIKYEIYYNGKKVSMKWIEENFGTLYAEILKDEIAEGDFDSMHSPDGMLDVFIW